MSISPLGNILQLTDVLAWLNLDGSENEDQVQAALDAANDAVLDELDWDPRSQQVIELVDGTGGCEQNVKRWPIQSVQAISRRAPAGGCFVPYPLPASSVPAAVPGGPAPGATWIPIDISQISWDDAVGIIRNPCGWCFGQANYQVTYTAGPWLLPANIPGSVKQALRYTVKAMLDAANVDHNATGESFSGVSSATWHPGGPGSLPPAAAALLHRYKRKF